MSAEFVRTQDNGAKVRPAIVVLEDEPLIYHNYMSLATGTMYIYHNSYYIRYNDRVLLQYIIYPNEFIIVLVLTVYADEPKLYIPIIYNSSNNRPEPSNTLEFRDRLSGITDRIMTVLYAIIADRGNNTLADANDIKQLTRVLQCNTSEIFDFS